MARKAVQTGSAWSYCGVHVEPRGYLKISIERTSFLGHRLAWLYVHGAWPKGCLDHANGDPRDNRLCNLRLASSSQNCGNRKRQRRTKSGLKGVVFRARKNKWEASIMCMGQARYLGQFDTPEQAHVAYSAAARELFGEFARAG